MAKTVSHTCDLCEEPLDEVREIETSEGVLVAGLGYVRMQGRVREVCVPCMDAVKNLTADRAAWAPNRAAAVNRLTLTRARVAEEDAVRKRDAEQRDREARFAAQREADTRKAAQDARRATFDALPEPEKIRAALAAVLDGSATDEERAFYATSLLGTPEGEMP